MLYNNYPKRWQVSQILQVISIVIGAALLFSLTAIGLVYLIFWTFNLSFLLGAIRVGFALGIAFSIGYLFSSDYKGFLKTFWDREKEDFQAKDLERQKIKKRICTRKMEEQEEKKAEEDLWVGG